MKCMTIAEYVEQVVASMPPPSPRQIEAAARILASVEPADVAA
jgi:hypothetical protein